MTYEQFEYQVINMLLAGDDPRLEKFRNQIWHLEVLSRYETKSGFVTTFSAPPALANGDIKSKFSGMTIEIEALGKVDIELLVENGLINSLRGTFIGTLGYSAILSHFDRLNFYYRNGRSSDIYFYSSDPSVAKEEPLPVSEAPVEHVEDTIEDDVQHPPQAMNDKQSQPVAQEATTVIPATGISEEDKHFEVETPDIAPTSPQAPSIVSGSPMTLGELVGYGDQPKRTPETPKRDMLYKNDEKNRRMQESLDALAFDDENDWEKSLVDTMKKKNNKVRIAIIVVCFLVGSLIGAIGMMLMLGIDLPFIN